jgi:hypothetical protein
MSILAQKWAWEQNIPLYSAKLVLIAMADQADARDGSVRYQDTCAEFFAAKCTMSARTFWRAVGLLEVNGYVRRHGHRGGGRGKATEFWLQLERAASSIAEWSEKVDENYANLAQFSDEKLCQIVQETVPKMSENCATGGTVSAKDIIANQSTKESTSARSRSRAGARAPARKEATSDPFQFVCNGTHLWRALERYRSSIGQAMPKFIHRGNGEHANHTGTYFRKSELSAASRSARGPPDDPPSTASDDDQSSEGEDDVGSGQFAAGLRSGSGSLARW